MARKGSRSYADPAYAEQLQRYAPEESFRRAVKDVNHRVVQYVQQAYQSDPTFFTNHSDIDRLTALMAPAVQAGQLQIADLTNAHLSTLFGVEHPPSPNLSTFERPNISRTRELARPFWTAIKAAQAGKDFDAALAAGEARLTKMVETDLQMAKVRQAREVLKAGGIRRYARVTGGNACWLCEIAATQVYYTEDLLPIHPGCVTGETMVSSPSRLEAATRRQFVGEVVELSTASGNLVRVTPNHPVLTDKGWIPAGLIRKGDNVFRSLRGERPVDGRPDVAQRPSRIEDVFAAASVTGRLLRVPTTAEDFHGDRSDGEVEIVWATSDLALPFDMLGVQQAGELCFMHAHGPRASLLGQGAFASLLDGRLAASRSSIRGSGDRGPFFSGGALISQYSGVTRPSRFNPTAAQFAGDGVASYAEQGRALVGRLARKVERDSVIECRRVGFAGHVFNLQTAEGWYVADNIVLSNCNCSVQPIPEGGEAEIRKGFTPEEILKHSDDQAKLMLGLVEGDAPLGDYQDLVAVREHGEVGPVLTWKHQSFTGPMDLPQPVGLPGAAREEVTVVRQWEQPGPPMPPEPVHINGVGYALQGRGIEEQTATEIQQAIQDMKEKYPQSKLSSVLVSSTKNGPPAATFPYGGGPGGYLTGETHIRVNKAELGNRGKDSWHEWITTELRANPRAIAHHANNTVEYELGLHEFGHTLAFTGGNRDLAIKEVDPTLRKLYKDLNPGIEKVDIQEFNAWKRKQLSDYSFQEGSWAKLNKDEALAEAFASVESNPKKATEAEHALHDLLVKNSLRPQVTAKALLERDFNAPAKVVADKEAKRAAAQAKKEAAAAEKAAAKAAAQAEKEAAKAAKAADLATPEGQIREARLQKLKGEQRLAAGDFGAPDSIENVIRSKMDPERIRRNREALWDEVPEPVRTEGKAWYPGDGQVLLDIHRELGSPLAADPLADLKVRALGSAFSPQVDWADAKTDVRNYLSVLGQPYQDRVDAIVKGRPRMVYTDSIKRADRVMAATTPEEIDLALRGSQPTTSHYYDNSQKIRHFFPNLDGNLDLLTADTWDGRAARLHPDERRFLINEEIREKNFASKHPVPLEDLDLYQKGDRIPGYLVARADKLADAANDAARAAGHPEPYLPSAPLMVQHGYDILESATAAALPEGYKMADYQAGMWVWLRGSA